jgi:hypothetical protein
MKFLLFTLIVATALAGNAQIRNPQIRVCALSGGYFGAIDVDDDQLPVCNIGGGVIGTQVLIDLKWYGRPDINAVAIFKFAKQPNPDACIENGGRFRFLTDDHGNQNDVGLCQFKDGSIIQTETLTRGSADPQNAALVRAFGI